MTQFLRDAQRREGGKGRESGVITRLLPFFTIGAWISNPLDFAGVTNSDMSAIIERLDTFYRVYTDIEFTNVCLSLKRKLVFARHSCEGLSLARKKRDRKWLTQIEQIELHTFGRAMADAARDDDGSRDYQEEDAPSPTAAAAVDAVESVVASAERVTSSSAQEQLAQTEEDEGERPRETEDFLDVVVTSADALDASSASGSGASGVVASAISASSSLLLGSQEYVVELVVTNGSGSYCIRRPLSELLAVLQAPDAASRVTSVPVSEIPEFPTKQSKNDALIAKWCGDMTQFLAGAKTTLYCFTSHSSCIALTWCVRAIAALSSALRDAPQWIAFIEESSQGKGSRAHMTAIEFILQPFQYEKVIRL